MLQPGQTFPDFRLPNQDGLLKTLADYQGQWLVLYVYPKDDTPGCTVQGKSFTATRDEFVREGVNVVGISADDVESHKNFCNKHSLTIDLLADPEGKLLSAAQVGQSEWKGTQYWDRTTFLIDPKGTLRKVYQQVKPEGHEQILLKDIRDLKSH